MGSRTNQLTLGNKTLDPIVTFSNEITIMAHWRAMTIVVWKQGHASMVEMTELDRLNQIASAQFGRYSLVHMVLPESRPPAQEVRDGLLETMKRYLDNFTCVAVLIENQGFMASALRGFLTAVHLLTGQRHKLKTFGELDRLAQWLAPEHSAATGVAVEASELLTVIERLRAQGLEGSIREPG